MKVMVGWQPTLRTEGVSIYDLFQDENGNIYIKPKSGIGSGEETGLNVYDFLDESDKTLRELI